MKFKFKERYQHIFVWPRMKVSSPESSGLSNSPPPPEESYRPHRQLPRLKFHLDFTATS
jgi:hypothetical protein